MVLGMIGPALRSFSLKYDTTVDKVALIMNIMGVCALTGAVFGKYEPTFRQCFQHYRLLVVT